MTYPSRAFQELRSVTDLMHQDTDRWNKRISSMEAHQLSSLQTREGDLSAAPRAEGPGNSTNCYVPVCRPASHLRLVGDE